MLAAYPASLNNVSFFSRDVSVKNQTLRKGSGVQWQRDAAVMTELKLTCIATFFSDMHAAAGATSNYHYRYNVLDTTPGGLADQGIFTPHTSELYAIWGTNNTDGGDPKCFKLGSASGGCSEAIRIVQSYWISFVRTLDPNTFRAAGAPKWETWTINSPRRIVFDNANATMETMGAGIGEVTIAGLNQRQRCNSLVLPLAKANNAGLKKGQTLQPFANGTRSDPTLLSTSIVSASALMDEDTPDMNTIIKGEENTNVSTAGNGTGSTSPLKVTGGSTSSRRYSLSAVSVGAAAFGGALLLL
jgi:hypothetical protein